MPKFKCPVQINCNYRDTLEVEAPDRESALIQAEEEGKHLDIDKMEQEWSHVEVDKDVVELGEDGKPLLCLTCRDSSDHHEAGVGECYLQDGCTQFKREV